MTRKIVVFAALMLVCVSAAQAHAYTYTYHNKTTYPVKVVAQLYDEADRSGEIKASESFAFSTKALLKSWVAEALIDGKWQRVLDMTCDLLPGNHTFFVYVEEAVGPDGRVGRNWNAIIE